MAAEHTAGGFHSQTPTNASSWCLYLTWTYNTEALSTTGWYKKHDLWDLVLLKRRILDFPLKTKMWPITNESPMSRSALARGNKQPKVVLHPHKKLWLTLPASLPPTFISSRLSWNSRKWVLHMSMHHIITRTALKCQHELLCHFRAQPWL